MRRGVARSLTLMFLPLFLSLHALGQTASTASVSGIVADQRGGVVSGATIALKNRATNIERSTRTDEGGKYEFANVDPGPYDLSVTAQNFKKLTITEINVEATKRVVQDFVLELGAISEEVSVAAGAEVQLQKQDAAVGNTIDRRYSQLPLFGRGIGAVLQLQPGIPPNGAVTGARQDQSAYALEGIDVSDNVVGATFRTVIPTPAEAVEEIRVTVANSNATFGRASGGQITLIGKRGTNQFHGSGYEYHRNSWLNANTWTNNRLGLPRPPLIDNNFGAQVNGPIFKDKTFFFVLFEGQRFPSSTQVTRIMPTSSLKQGLLRFRDGAGVVQTIDPRTLDPRGIGANPAVLELLRKLPDPNDFTQGDGLNTAGLTVNIPTKLRSDQGWARLDHAFSDKWRFDATFSANRTLQNTASQVDIVNRRGTTNLPARQRFLSAGLTGVLNPRLTNEFRFGWVHDRSFTGRIDPFGQVPAANIALDIAGGFLDEPIDVDTQRSRTQGTTSNVYQYVDNVNWVRGSHTIQSGFNVRHIATYHLRNDKVVGSISIPVAVLSSSTLNQIPSNQRPGFIQAGDASRYNALYAGLLGEVENITYMQTRNGQLQPNPIGTPLVANSSLNAYEVYAADTWRMKPSLVLSYGLIYTWQVPPIEKNGQQVVQVYAQSLAPVGAIEYLRLKREAAERGEVFNPTLAYLPLKDSGRKYAFNLDRKNLSPRFSAAWNPSFNNGLLGKLLGERKTVVRGGYSLVYDRLNTVQTVIVPTLGVGFAQTLQTGAAKNAAGQPFRVGIDGPLPVPQPTGTTPPIIPGVGAVTGANTPSEVLSFVVDPFTEVPHNHVVDFTVQRLLGHNMTLEVGYIGRFGRNLYQSLNLNQVPYMFKDKVSGQTFAQAFDKLAAEVRALVPAANVTPQPWFENVLVNLAPFQGSRTRAFANNATRSANITNGNLSSLFFSIDSGGMAAQPFDPFLQSQEMFVRSNGGRSNYNALFMSLRRRLATGLTFDFNYTLSRSLDQIGFIQNIANLMPNSFDLDAEYGPSLFDLTHVFNANWVYDLPFGQGRAFATTKNPFLSRLLSGWFTSGIFRATSAAPITIVQGGQVWGGSINLPTNSGAIGIPGADFSSGVHRGVNGSGQIGLNGNPANRGAGLNLFSDPEKVFNSVRRLRISEDTRSGRAALRGLPFWQVDLSIGKRTNITERVKFGFSVDFVNAFNNVIFNDPGTSLQSPANFGVISSQGNIPRRIQVGARVEF